MKHYTAVKLVHDGKADMYMKGLIDTKNFLKSVLDKEVGLPSITQPVILPSALIFASSSASTVQGIFGLTTSTENKPIRKTRRNHICQSKV